MIYFTACLNGTYGQECNNTCGNCFGQEQCLHTNGTCLSGCDTGFVGEECKTGMSKNNIKHAVNLKLLANFMFFGILYYLK